MRKGFRFVTGPAFNIGHEEPAELSMHMQFCRLTWSPEASDIASVFGDAFSERWRTTMSQALQHLAFARGFLPDACPKKFATS